MEISLVFKVKSYSQWTDLPLLSKKTWRSTYLWNTESYEIMCLRQAHPLFQIRSWQVSLTTWSIRVSCFLALPKILSLVKVMQEPSSSEKLVWSDWELLVNHSEDLMHLLFKVFRTLLLIQHLMNLYRTQILVHVPLKHADKVRDSWGKLK